MIDTTLCYIERDDQYLMLYRNKKKNDINAGKWIGVGGKFEQGETPEACVIREAKEETGLRLIDPVLRGILYFYSDQCESEAMYLYTADQFDGTVVENCDEGELRWVPKAEVMQLPLWEGDRLFLPKLLGGEMDIRMSLYYEGDKLVRALDGSPIDY